MQYVWSLDVILRARDIYLFIYLLGEPIIKVLRPRQGNYSQKEGRRRSFNVVLCSNNDCEHR